MSLEWLKKCISFAYSLLNQDIICHFDYLFKLFGLNKYQISDNEEQINNNYEQDDIKENEEIYYTFQKKPVKHTIDSQDIAEFWKLTVWIILFIVCTFIQV